MKFFRTGLSKLRQRLQEQPANNATKFEALEPRKLMSSVIAENLIVNGSFEDLGGQTFNRRRWGTFEDIPGWHASFSAENGPIEIQKGRTGGTHAQDGKNKLELNSHAFKGESGTNAHVYQDIQLSATGSYELSFYYSPRVFKGTDTDNVEVWWDGILLDTLTPEKSGDQWQQFTYEVSGNDTTRLEFRGSGKDDTRGGFIDNVSLLEVSSPPSTPSPIGDEQPIYNARTFGDHRHTATAAFSDGSYVVAWSSTGPQDHLLGVYIQRYDTEGNALSEEILANTYHSSHQVDPDVTTFSDGTYLVVWGASTNPDDGVGYGVAGQRYDASDNRIGREFLINTTVYGNQGQSKVTTLNDGNYIVTWNSTHNQDGSGTGVFGQLFDGSSNRIGSEFLINTYTDHNQWVPSINALLDGGFIVVWQSVQDGSLHGIYGQRFDATGNKMGEEFKINTHIVDNQIVPDVTELANGDLVVVWQSENQDGSEVSVFAQRFDSNGIKLGTEFRINTYSEYTQDQPIITGLNDGGFVVVWRHINENKRTDGLFGQRYDENGNRIGEEFQVNTSDNIPTRDPSIATLNDGTFVVAWAGFDFSTSELVSGVFRRHFTL